MSRHRGVRHRWNEYPNCVAAQFALYAIVEADRKIWPRDIHSPSYRSTLDCRTEFDVLLETKRYRRWTANKSLTHITMLEKALEETRLTVAALRAMTAPISIALVVVEYVQAVDALQKVIDGWHGQLQARDVFASLVGKVAA